MNEHDQTDERCGSFYRDAMALLQQARVPFLVGGAFAFAQHTGIQRSTKDFDLFVLPRDADRALRAFAKHGFTTEKTAAYWLGKAFKDDLFVDLIWSSGNGVAEVDERWFERAPMEDVLGEAHPIVPVEEMIWQKAYIMERERFDGADVIHLIHARGREMDWDHLVRLFGPHWEVLLAHLILYRFAYPGERERVPAPVMHLLTGRLERTVGAEEELTRLMQGTLLSRYQYRDEVNGGGYRDARLDPPADLSEKDLGECA